MFRADAVSLEAALAMLESIRALLGDIPGAEALSVIGPIPALMTRRIGRSRAQLCLLAPGHRQLRAVLGPALPRIAALATPRGVNWSVDVDAPDL